MKMAICKFPGCEKVLVGKEKHLCKSCKDKIKDKAKKTGKYSLSALAVIIAFIIKSKTDSKNDSISKD